jgi:hypothetical protein
MNGSHLSFQPSMKRLIAAVSPVTLAKFRAGSPVW